MPLVSRDGFECKRRVPDWLIVTLLGIVEGITEFLPISSTAHLLICEQLMPGGEKFVGNDLFNIVIQSGAVLAVIPLFRHRLVQLRQWREPRSRDLIAKIALAFCVTAAGGLYSLLSHAVGRRRREFGIRWALGGSARAIGALVLRDAIVTTVIGLAIGSIAAWDLAAALASVQFGVTISDPLSWALVLGVVAVVTFGASWRPMQNAMAVDVALSFRDE